MPVTAANILANDDVVAFRARREFGTKSGLRLFDKKASGNEILYDLVEGNCPKCLDAVLADWKDVDPNEVPADVEVTPFYVAVDVQHHECAKVFLKHSKLRPINLGRSSTTDVPLIAAIHNGDVSFVRVLVAHSPPIDVNECTTEMDDCIEGVTPMMHAIRTKQPDMATVLLEAGDRLKVNAADDEGKTALHLAVVGEGMGEVVEKLLKAGADPMAMDKKGKSPIDVAEKDEIKRLINEFKQDAKMEE